MAVLDDAQDRIAFAAEGVSLAGGEALDLARDHAAALLTLLAVAAAALALALSLGGEGRVSSAASIEPSSTASYLSERGFSILLPAGWERTQAPDGSAFSAGSADGRADATLWVERDPNLGYRAFVEQSMASLDEIGTGVRVSNRIAGSTLESRIIELQAEVPLDGGLTAPYRVTLRAAGPYRYYLATSIQPDAPVQLLADAEVLGSSLQPASR